MDQKLLIAIVHTANGAEDTCTRSRLDVTRVQLILTVFVLRIQVHDALPCEVWSSSAFPVSNHIDSGVLVLYLHCVAMLTTDVYPDVFLLSGIFPFGVKLSLLGRLLSDDEAEMKRMKTYLLRGHNGRRVPEEEIFHGLIYTVLDPSRDGRVDDEQHRWSKDGWYCLRCIKDLYRQRFMAWWRQTKEIGTLPAFVSAYSHPMCLRSDCWDPVKL